MATALKRRQLRAAGWALPWALLSVPYWEWDEIEERGEEVEEAGRAYLERGLRTAAGEGRVRQTKISRVFDG